MEINNEKHSEMNMKLNMKNRKINVVKTCEECALEIVHRIIN